MPKRTSQPTQAGKLAGTDIKIASVYNEGLREHVAIINQGTVAQPLSGWILVAWRGNRLYFFPDGVILTPGMKVLVHSGQGALNSPPVDLFWTDEQMWSNRNDMALLFDANGLEIDRCAYPHARLLGSDAPNPMQLVREGDTWRLSEAPPREVRKLVRQAKVKVGPKGSPR